MENKKIKNAKVTIFNGIKFKSLLERACYRELEKSGLTFSHESDKFRLWEGVKLKNLKVFLVKGRLLQLNTTKLQDTTYCPDFRVEYKDFIIFIETKGFPNDSYPLKRKLFLKILDQLNDGHKYIFIEPHSVGQMIQAINIIRTLE